MNVDLLAVSSELGYIEDGVYTADENCKENLDSMFEMVQKDDASGSYRQQVGSAGIFTSDLVPLLGQKIEDEEIFDSLIRLLTSMTDPVRTNSPQKTKVDMYNQKVLEGYLLDYKKAFHNALLWVKLRSKIVKFLRKECPKNSPDLTGLTLNFVRNLITIEDSDESQVLVVCYADSGMARLIQYIASAADLDEWHLHATEIFSGLLKDTSPVTISSIDPQKDALKHSSFSRPCMVMDECTVDYTPSMEDRMQSAKLHKHYEITFLHYYFSSISNYCAEGMANSLLSKVDSVDCKYKIAVGQMCIWLVNFVSVFDSNRIDLSGDKNSRVRNKVTNLFTLGVKLSAELVNTSHTGLMRSFVRRSIDLFSILKQFSNLYSLKNKSEDVIEVAKSFIADRMKELLSVDNSQLGSFVFEFIDAMLTFLSPNEGQLFKEALHECNIVQLISHYLTSVDTEQITTPHCECILNVISKCTRSIDELCTPSILRLVFASTTKICSSELSEFQIRLFQYIKSKADSEDELIKVCKEIVDDDPKLLAELALLFQFTIDSPSNQMKTEPDESETRNYETEAERIKPLLTNPDTRLAKLADRMYKQIQNNILMQAVTIDDSEVAEFSEVMQFLGFNLENKVWHHAAGTLHPTLIKSIELARPLASEAVSLVASRSIGTEQTKKKKKRGIGKNKKPRPGVEEGGNINKTQMEIF